MFQRAIVRLPSKNFAMGMTTAELGKPKYDRALNQHELYCSALEHCGLTLVRLDADERCPDSAFVEDTALLTERCAILARPGAVSRAGEVSVIAEVLERFYSEIHSIHAPGTLDGGDVCEADNHFYIGISRRTNEAGARQLAAFLASVGYTSSFVDIRSQTEILHLKSGLAYLCDNRMVVIDALANYKAFRDFDLIRVDSGEEYAANCVRVNGVVLVAAGFSAFEKRLVKLGYQTIAVEMSEFQKMDGGLSCLSLRL